MRLNHGTVMVLHGNIRTNAWYLHGIPKYFCPWKTYGSTYWYIFGSVIAHFHANAYPSHYRAAVVHYHLNTAVRSWTGWLEKPLHCGSLWSQYVDPHPAPGWLTEYKHHQDSADITKQNKIRKSERPIPAHIISAAIELLHQTQWMNVSTGKQTYRIICFNFD